MNKAITWIGGATAATLLLFGGAIVAGKALEAPQAALPPALVAPSSPDQPEARTRVTDERPADGPFVIKTILPIEGAIRYGEWHWDESGAPSAGALVVTVDLDARVISVFRDGHEIGAAAALLGTVEHPTPLGTFPILSKERHNVSEKYDDAPMPYTLRLTHEGVSVHGSMVENGYASHGCVGVPEEFAARLFAVASKGDMVIVTRGKTAGLGDALMAG